jgi:hypothetical protein
VDVLRRTRRNADTLSGAAPDVTSRHPAFSVSESDAEAVILFVIFVLLTWNIAQFCEDLQAAILVSCSTSA